MRFFAALLIGLGLSVTSLAQSERITSFDSQITVHTDGVLEVTETIVVIAAGDQIRRGIYRDFPTVRGRTTFGKFNVSFDVQEVLRNGAPEPWFTDTIPDGVRLYIGRSDRNVPKGQQTYVIRYVTDRQIGFFDNRDEIYWNVTGNFWAFPIDKASATVQLPDGAELVETAAFTGPVGATGTDYVLQDRRGSVAFETTRRLDPGEGLTIGVAIAPGVIVRPSLARQAAYLLRDNAAAVVSIIGLLLVSAYYLMVWVKYGKDPEPGTIIAQYEPPPGLSPAACRFIDGLGWDPKALTSALVSIAAKGYLKIGMNGSGDTTLSRTENADASVLSHGEKKVANLLLNPFGTIVLNKDAHRQMTWARDALKEYLTDNYELVYFLLNRGIFFIGVGLSVAVIALAAWLAIDPSGLIVIAVASPLFLRGLMQLLIIGGLAGRRRIKFAAASWAMIGAVGLMVYGVLQDPEARQAFIYMFQSIEFWVAMALGAVNVVFYDLMKAPTDLGRKVIDHIEGFRLYLTVAEKDRLNFHNPPDVTPEKFEEYLPYAIALDVEHEWGEQFDLALQRQMAEGKFAEDYIYHPGWYWDRYNHGFSAGRFATDLTRTMVKSVATASTAPSSSGGGFSGGGGSSGGGGGGGGGGGW